MKSKVSFVCQECGYDSPQWLGKCPECGLWNSFKEIKDFRSQPVGLQSSAPTAVIKPRSLSQIASTNKERVATGFGEMDGVMGGGIVKGSVTLLAGDPGVGKSTLLLQLALNLSNKTNKSHWSHVLYISGEESEEQIKLRAERIKVSNEKKVPKVSKEHEKLLLVSATNADAIVSLIQETKPSLVVVDSIQTMESENAGGLAGSVGQIRYATGLFIKAAKSLSIPTVIVGHVTKEGMVAGPMLLSHMVDVVLFLEGEKSTEIRVLRSLKNRFGPIDEVGIFRMDASGMQEAGNPQDLFFHQEKDAVPGSVLTAVLEGSRVFLLELQALTVSTRAPYPRRVASGIDGRRLELLLAVLQKHCRLPLDTMDVFVNIAGGMKVVDRAVDLAVCLAIASSVRNVALKNTVGTAEVGLLGELRSVPMLPKRIKEAEKLGIKKIYSVKSNKYLNEIVSKLTVVEK